MLPLFYPRLGSDVEILPMKVKQGAAKRRAPRRDL